MWNASHVQKTLQLNLTGMVESLEVRNCAKEIFLRPCSKDFLVLMQLSQIAKTVQLLGLKTVEKRHAGSWLSRLPWTKMKKIEQVRGLSVPNPYHCATDASSLDGDI